MNLNKLYAAYLYTTFRKKYHSIKLILPLKVLKYEQRVNRIWKFD